MSSYSNHVVCPQNHFTAADMAKRLDQEAMRRKTSVSAIVSELVRNQPDQLPYAALIDDDEDLSLRVMEILARLDS